MKTIQDVIDKRNEIFERMMDNATFSMMYNSDSDGAEDEILSKLQKLDNAIYDFQHDDCGCGMNMRLEALKSMVRELDKEL